MSPKFLLASLLVTACSSPAFAASEPWRPSDDAQVLERVAVQPAEAGSLRALNAQRRALAAKPEDLDAALAYARRAIELGRETADPRYHGRADASLRPWLALADPPPVVRLLRATLRQQRHDFAGALADLDALIAREGHDGQAQAQAQARLTRATVLMVQGRPAEALADCNALVAARANLLAAATCIASVRSLDGHAAAAIEVLKAALAESIAAPAGERLWAMSTLAEIEARQERPRDAEAHYQAALVLLRETGAQDPYLLTAWADQLLASGRAAEALALTRDFRQIDNLLLRHALAQAALGDPGLADSRAQLEARYLESGLRGESVHLREEALSALRLQQDPGKAAERASRNWLTQREPADARLLLEASLASKQPALAAPVLDWLQRTGIEDPALRALAAQLKALPAVEARR